MEQLTRRQALTIAAATCAACACCADAADEPAADSPPAGAGDKPKGPAPKEINIGKSADFAKPGFYDKFRDSQIFVARIDNKLVAMSSRCTHKACSVRLKDGSTTVLRCPCHKAEFAEHGQPVSGPAKVALPRFALKQNSDGTITVETTKSFAEKQWDDPAASITIPAA